MKDENLIIDKLEGFSGVRLKGKKPLIFKPGINLLVGRNGCGKTNLIRLIQLFATNKGDVSGHIESSYFVKKAEASLKKHGAAVSDKFGNVTIATHSLKGAKGYLKMSLKNVPKEFVLRNIIRDPAGFHTNITLHCKTEPVQHRLVYGNAYPPKFEMSGYVSSSNLFSREHDNVIHSSMQGPLESVSQFIRSRLKEFYESDDFISRILNFENTVNEKFSRFLNQSNKRVKINRNDLATSGRISLTLMDNENHIQSANISTGEATLFNLVFSLASAKEEGCKIISLDEPDVHMHDDMIRVLVSELWELLKALPSCIIIVASHSTALIEQLAASGGNLVHIITFDNDRNVGNSENDIELINALHRNGVHFSPLMLSKKKNIFIENQFEKGESHKDFLLKFFSSEDIPNIIPIGNSGNVQDSKSFAHVFENLLKVAKLNSVGVRDGDIWLKPLLVKYLKGELELRKLVNVLKRQRGMYIPQDDSNSNSYFLNCWEIENLYLMDEVLPCWRLNNGSRLTKSGFVKLLQLNRHIIVEQYFDMFYKSITRIRVDKKYSIQGMRAFLQGKFIEIEKGILNASELEDRMRFLVDSLFDSYLIHWMPGKEVRKFLLSKHYTFTEDGFDFKNSELALQVRKILTK